MVAYPTFTHKARNDGSLTLTPNVIKSEFLGGFTAVSGNGRRKLIKELTIVQPLTNDIEFQTLEDFMRDNIATSFTIEYLDRDKTGATTMTVYFDGSASLSTASGRMVMSFGVKEA